MNRFKRLALRHLRPALPTPANLKSQPIRALLGAAAIAVVVWLTTTPYPILLVLSLAFFGYRFWRGRRGGPSPWLRGRRARERSRRMRELL